MYGFDFVSNYISKHEEAAKNETRIGSKPEVNMAPDWARKFRQFTDKHMETCTYPHPKLEQCSEEQEKKFVTNSTYKGMYTIFGFNGTGVFTFPNGTVYKGDFLDDMFEGRGTMIFPCGTIVRGKWVEGVLIKPAIYFNRLQYDQDWLYCKMPDRRFEIEFLKFVQPAGKSYLTNDQLPKKIPEGYYDAGDGFFDPKINCVVRYDDVSTVLRSTSNTEGQWIMRYCRKYPEECVGPLLVTEYPQPKLFLDETQFNYSELTIKEIDLENQRRSMKNILDTRLSKTTNRYSESKCPLDSLRDLGDV